MSSTLSEEQLLEAFLGEWREPRVHFPESVPEAISFHVLQNRTIGSKHQGPVHNHLKKLVQKIVKFRLYWRQILLVGQKIKLKNKENFVHENRKGCQS